MKKPGEAPPEKTISARPAPERREREERHVARPAAATVTARPPAEAKDAPRSAGAHTTAGKPSPKKPSRSQRNEAGRDFIIAYDGRFLGHYRSAKRITNRTAFQNVVRQLNPSIENFDIAKIRLYRPVPIDVEPPGSLEDMTDGSFEWFSTTSEPAEGIG